MTPPEPATAIDRIRQALRTYHAANNAARQAHADLTAALPPGVAVLQCRPGESGKPETYYIWHQRNEGTPGFSFSSCHDPADAGWSATKRAVIVELPGVSEETLDLGAIVPRAKE